jgi:hypothetical protein
MSVLSVSGIRSVLFCIRLDYNVDTLPYNSVTMGCIDICLNPFIFNNTADKIYPTLVFVWNCVQVSILVFVWNFVLCKFLLFLGKEFLLLIES